MVRIARVVIPDVPHHITQRGNRRQTTFFCDNDYNEYRELLKKQCSMNKVTVLAYCLMPNHVHLILVPETVDGIRGALSETHRRYSRMINFREKWKGHLWQDRFASYPMDEPHLIMAARYIEMNPVRAGLVRNPIEWSWSSATNHVRGEDDGLVKVKPLLDIVPDWQEFLEEESEFGVIRQHESTGRPLGDSVFVERCERSLGRILRRQKPGPKKKVVTS